MESDNIKNIEKFATVATGAMLFMLALFGGCVTQDAEDVPYGISCEVGEDCPDDLWCDIGYDIEYGVGTCVPEDECISPSRLTEERICFIGV